MKLAVVIVNYRTAGLAIDCLRSLVPELASVPGTRVLVVDNASGDGSEERLRSAIESEGWSTWATLLPAGRNGGFGSGNNVALRSLLARPEKPEYVHLLNPDARALPGALRALVEFMDSHPAVGIAGSRLEDPGGKAESSAFRFHNLASEFESPFRLGIVSRLLSRNIVAIPPRAEAHPADWVSGASMLIRSRVLEDVGLFDEDFFLYFEETDLCLRAQRAGWSCWHVPQSRVVHLGGQSTGMYDLSQPMPPYWFESRRRYLHKHHGRLYLLAANVIWITGFSLWRVRRRLQNKPETNKPRMLSDFIRLSFTDGKNAR